MESPTSSTYIELWFIHKTIYFSQKLYNPHNHSHCFSIEIRCCPRREKPHHEAFSPLSDNMSTDLGNKRYKIIILSSKKLCFLPNFRPLLETSDLPTSNLHQTLDTSLFLYRIAQILLESKSFCKKPTFSNF